MNVTKRLLSLLLAVITLFSFAACSSDAADSTDTGKKETTAADTTAPVEKDEIFYEPDSLPENLNFDGAEIMILSASEYNPEGEKDTLPEITVEELTSDIINDSIYNRELYVEERLGVEIGNYQVNIAKVDDEINKQYNAGDDTFDIFVHSAHILSNHIFDGYLLDLYEVDHLDFSKPWWSQKFSRAAELQGALHVATGSLALTLSRNIYGIFYNKTLAENYSDKIPELGDLYSLVESGKWTFDTCVSLSGDIYEDINGDSEFDIGDEYGIYYPTYIPTDCIWSGFDIKVFSRTDDGWYELNVNTDKAFTALDKLYKLLFETKGNLAAGGFENDPYAAAEYFADGHILFTIDRLGAIEWPYLRNMQDDYGILPYPKFDENQKEYYSFAHERYSAFAIPASNPNPEIAGAVLEAMASYAYRDTEPAFLDTALKGKYMTDAKSRYMLDVLIDGFMIDAAWLYIDSLGKGYLTSYREMLEAKQTSFATNHQKKAKMVEIALKAYREVYDRMYP